MELPTWRIIPGIVGGSNPPFKTPFRRFRRGTTPEDLWSPWLPTGMILQVVLETYYPRRFLGWRLIYFRTWKPWNSTIHVGTIYRATMHGMGYDMISEIWYDTIWYDMICNIVLYDLYDMMWYDIVCEMLCYNAQCNMTMLWYSVIWYFVDMLWFDLM